jgi:cephalosporin-C deacetylase-like acetyl esterase
MNSRLVAMILGFSAALAAQSSDDPWRRMERSKAEVNAYMVRTAREITDRAGEEIRSVESWEKLRARRLEEMRYMLGLLPWPKRTPLNVRITGTLDKGSYTVEKIAFESLPKIYVTANLYVPKAREGKLPGIIYVCGHAYSPAGDKTKYQRHGISLAKNGYVAMILDSIQISETFGMHHGIDGQSMYDWYSRGYTPAGVEVWNAMRAIDYLETRPEVDKDRIGMTGRSGGAAQSWFTAAVDPRIKVVAPVMGISTYAANLKENTQRLHCDCMFAINSHLHDMLHQGALIAPRPLLMAHGRKDNLFPIPGYKEFEERVGALYGGYGKSDAFRNIEVDTAHQDSDYLREQVIQWFDRHLKQVPERKLDMDYTDASEESLAVFGGKPPADAQNFRVHQTFTTRPPSPRFKTLAAWEDRRKALVEELRSKVFRTIPEKRVAQVTKRSPYRDGFDELEFEVDSGVPVHAFLKKPAKPEATAPALLYIASDGEGFAYINEILSGVRARIPAAAILAVYPRGVGEVGWDMTFWKDTLRNAMHTGQTVDSMRLKDLLGAFEILRGEAGVNPDRITVLGKGISGAIGLYAAILEPRVEQVILIDPPVTHAQGPIFLDVMRHTDLPEAAALLSPRRLNFLGRMPAEYDYTRHVYGLAGKQDKVFVAMSVEGVLQGRYDYGFASGL